MDPAVKAEWIGDLRSGNYRQGTGTLRNARDEYCCLGVLCEQAVRHGVIPPATGGGRMSDSDYEYEGRTAYLPEAVAAWAGIPTNGVIHYGDPLDPLGVDLAQQNDNGKPFTAIADLIEEYA